MPPTASIRRITPERPAGAENVSFWFPACLLRNRVLLRQMTEHEIKLRYQSSMLGIFWAFFTPLCSLLIYTFVFAVAFGVEYKHNGQIYKGLFPLIILIGLTAYNIFSESVSTSTRIIVSNSNYVKKVVFPLEILPISSLFAATYFGAIWFLIGLAGIGIFMHQLCVTVICLPLLIVPLLLFTAGMSWLLASLGVYIRDTPHVVTILLLVMLYLTGIFYSPSILPPLYQRILFLNPLAVIVEEMRRVMLFNEWPNWWRLAEMTLASFAVAQLGYMWFTHTKKGFADVI